ncbi:MAG: hypothetical protein ABW012_02430 [Gaiellaceae bacterium]
MRGPVAWIVAIVAGIALVIIATAMVGNRDDSGETVPAGQWAQSVCGSIGVWRGEIEDIVDGIRQAPATGTGLEEPQSQTPQGSPSLVRSGLEESIRATEVLVTGIDNSGTPDTDEGEAAATQVSSWATASLASLNKAEDSLETEAATPEEAIAQLAGATGAIRLAIVGGYETLMDVALLDPELAAALHESSTCEQLREEQGA